MDKQERDRRRRLRRQVNREAILAQGRAYYAEHRLNVRRARAIIIQRLGKTPKDCEVCHMLPACQAVTDGLVACELPDEMAGIDPTRPVLDSWLDDTHEPLRSAPDVWEDGDWGLLDEMERTDRWTTYTMDRRQHG